MLGTVHKSNIAQAANRENRFEHIIYPTARPDLVPSVPCGEPDFQVMINFKVATEEVVVNRILLV